MNRLVAAALFVIILLPAPSRADNSYEAQLERGISNSEAGALQMIEQAKQRGADRTGLLNRALMYAPDMPSVYFAVSRASLDGSATGILNSIDYALQGISAYQRNFWWSFTFTGGLFFSLILSFLLAILLVVVVRLLRDVPLIGHDLTEGNLTVAVLILLLPISALSPLLFLAGCMLFLAIYMKNLDRLVFYLLLIVIFSFPLILKTATYFVEASVSPSLKAVAEVNEGRGNDYALSVLRNREDYASRFSYGLALKRSGRFKEALDIFEKLNSVKPDARVLVNIGNCYVGMYNFSDSNKAALDDALASYQSAVSLQPLASAYYNLSQVSREMIDFVKGDEYFKKALTLDRAAVAEYRSISSRSPNRFVVDENLPGQSLWSYAGQLNARTLRFGLVALPPVSLSIAACLLLALFFYLIGRKQAHAFRCGKCSDILCSQCEKRLMWGRMCPQCYASLVKLDESEVKERVSRILRIYSIQRRNRDMLKILSFIMPGLPQVFAGRVFYGFVLLWVFLFLILLPLTLTFLTPAGGIISHSLFGWAALLIAALLYLVALSVTRRRILKGWL